MRILRKLSVFALFFFLFATAAYTVFPAQLQGMTHTLFTGGGLGTSLLPTEGADANAYLLHRRGGEGYTLYGLSDSGRKSKRTLDEGLPEEYEAQGLYIAQDGAVLLSLYTRSGVRLAEYGLYAAPQDGAFYPLIKEPLKGDTADQKRQSIGLLQVEESGGQLRLTVLQGGAYIQYAVQGQGLKKLRALDSAQAEALCAQLERQREAAAQTVAQSGLDPLRVTALSATSEGGALAVLDEAALYRVSPDGTVQNLSAGLYGRRWQSGLCLLGALLLLLALSYGCYYFIGEANKLYFPLAVKNFILLTLAGYLAVGAVVGLVIAPALRGHGRAAVQSVLRAQAQLAAETPALDPVDAARRVARIGEAYEDAALLRFTRAGQGWAVEASSDACTRLEEIPGELARVRQAEKGRYLFTASYRGDPAYFAYAPAGKDGLVCLRLNARALERALDGQILMVRSLSLGVVGLVVLLALLALARAARGARRATRAIGLVAQGNAQVRVVQHSGDELEALAAAVNDLSAQKSEQHQIGRSQSDAYLRFVPQQLVALLGVLDIKQVDKNTTASHEMAVMAVRFVIPQPTRQRDAQALFDDINEVFSYVARPVSAAGGAIYSFTYDGFDAVFKNGIKTAVGAAVAVRQALLDMNTQREARRLDAVKLQVALDYGAALIGVVGDEDRVVPTVVSDCLHTAYRMAQLAPMLDANILCTAAVADAAEEYALRYIGKCRDGGRKFRVYEIYDGDVFEVRQAKESSRELFSSGIYAFYSGNFSQAKAQFMEIARRPGEDGVAHHYLYLADQYEKQPPEQIELH